MGAAGRRLAFVALLLALAAPVPACLAETVRGAAAWAALPAAAPSGILRARFTQVREARALGRPLESSGHVAAVPGKGILWVLEDPFPVAVAVTPGRVTQREGDGPAQELPASAQPLFQALLGLFLGTRPGQGSLLADGFEPELERDAGRWTLRLVPKDPLLAKGVSRVEVEGASFVDVVRVLEPGGDRTTIAFTGHTLGGAGLAPAEEAALRD